MSKDVVNSLMYLCIIKERLSSYNLFDIAFFLKRLSAQIGIYKFNFLFVTPRTQLNHANSVYTLQFSWQFHKPVTCISNISMHFLSHILSSKTRLPVQRVRHPFRRRRLRRGDGTVSLQGHGDRTRL